MNPASRSQGNYSPEEALPIDFTPGDTDCICVRGRVSNKHKGNVYFKDVVKRYLTRYSEAPTKFDKTLLVTEIVQQVREGSPVGGFVKKIGDRWYRANDQLAREKVGQLLRNLLHDKYKSSNKAKKARRQADESLFDEGVDLMMNQLQYIDIKKRVGQLTVNAKTDADFQLAFNQANSELLDQLNNGHMKPLPARPDDRYKMKPPPRPDDRGKYLP